MEKNEVMPWDNWCPIYKLFDTLGKKWTIFILFCIENNINTFNAIMKRLPQINSKVLSDRLDLLIEKWLITREVTTNKPLKITYKLTDYWRELSIKLQDIWDWQLARK